MWTSGLPPSINNLQTAWRTNLAVLVSVEGQAEHVWRVLGGAVGLRTISVLQVLDAEGRAAGVTGGGPHYPGRVTCPAQQRLQFPDLDHRHKVPSTSVRVSFITSNSTAKTAECFFFNQSFSMVFDTLHIYCTTTVMSIQNVTKLDITQTKYCCNYYTTTYWWQLRTHIYIYCQIKEFAMYICSQCVLYQEKMAKEVGGKNLLQPIWVELVLLSQEALCCRKHVDDISAVRGWDIAKSARTTES